jgi:predicted ester cyclase
MAKAQGLSHVEGMKTFFKDYFVAFPDYNVSIEYIGAEDNKVFAILNWKGTHQKPFRANLPLAKPYMSHSRSDAYS